LHAQGRLRYKALFCRGYKMPVGVDSHQVFELYQCDHGTNIDIFYLIINNIDLTNDCRRCIFVLDFKTLKKLT
jgi:hypothetical protein